MIALHGFPPGRHVPYELWVALFFALPRHRLQVSVMLLDALETAASASDLGPEWADAAALDESQVEDWLAGSNRPRAVARLKRNLRWG